MHRLACVDIPAFPLQLLLRERPEWAGLPAAVVDEDKPLGLVRWVNGRARDGGVLPGLRYGPALALLPTLRAGTISDEAVAAGVAATVKRLQTFSPGVEAHASEPGLFWLDAGGLEPLYTSAEAWARGLRDVLLAEGLVSAVVVGFTRFGTYAAAKVLRGRKAVVFGTPQDETEVMRGVPLGLLGLLPETRDTLAKLGVYRMRDFLALPAHGVLKRFGPEAYQLYRFAAGELDLPLSPAPLEIPQVERLELGYREDNAERLVFTLKPLVDNLLAALARQGRALVELVVTYELEDLPEREDRIRMAEPTLASVTVMELVRLRLESGPLTAPALGLAVSGLAVPATSDQLAMFAETPRRDPAAAARAFARLRAAFGDEGVVVRAVMRDRHTPEGSFAWEPLGAIALPHPPPKTPGALVRRILAHPRPLPPEERRHPDGWLLGSPEYGPVQRIDGPYRITGGWWRRGIERDYYFAEMRRGELLWVFYDRERRRWFLQGEVN